MVGIYTFDLTRYKPFYTLNGKIFCTEDTDPITDPKIIESQGWTPQMVWYFNHPSFEHLMYLVKNVPHIKIYKEVYDKFKEIDPNFFDRKYVTIVENDDSILTEEPKWAIKETVNCNWKAYLKCNSEEFRFPIYFETKEKVISLRRYVESHKEESCLTHIDAVPGNFLFYNKFQQFLLLEMNISTKVIQNYKIICIFQSKLLSLSLKNKGYL